MGGTQAPFANTLRCQLSWHCDAECGSHARDFNIICMSLLWDHIGWVAAGCIIFLVMLNWNFITYTGKTRGPILAINFSWLIILDMTAAAVGVIMGIISVLHDNLRRRLSNGTGRR